MIEPRVDRDIDDRAQDQGTGWRSQVPPHCAKGLDLTLELRGSSLILPVLHKSQQYVVGQLPDQCMNKFLALTDHARDTHDKSE